MKPARLFFIVATLICSFPAAVLTDDAPMFLLKWGVNGSGPGEFKSPHQIAVDVQGNVYVADTGNNRIQKFQSDGVFVTQWGSTGSGAGQFEGPTGLAIAPDGNVYVADVAKLGAGGRGLALAYLPSDCGVV